MVPTLYVKGFNCVVEDYVLTEGAAGHAVSHLLSLVGSREAVRAIWARLMKSESAYVLALTAAPGLDTVAVGQRARVHHTATDKTHLCH